MLFRSQRAEERIGSTVTVLVESLDEDDEDNDGNGSVIGRAEHQAPETDGITSLTGNLDGVRVGDLLTAKVVASEGVDLIAEVLGTVAGVGA